MRTLQRSILAVALTSLLAFSTVANAFRPASTCSNLVGAARKAVALDAWSMPTMDMPSMKSTWYQECNPTARKTVYNDVFNDYGYSNSEDEDDTSGWIMAASSSSGALYANAPRYQSSTTNQEEMDHDQGGGNTRRTGPLRRVARWAKKRVFRG